MTYETVVIEEVRNLDGDHFRVKLWTQCGILGVTFDLALDVPPLGEWTDEDWSKLVSDVDDPRPAGSPDIKRLLMHAAYNLSHAAFMNVPLESSSDDAARVSGGGARGVSVVVLGEIPIPVRVDAYDGAGDDDRPFRTWSGEIVDATALVIAALASKLRARRADAVDSTATAVNALVAQHGMELRRVDAWENGVQVLPEKS